MSNENEEGVDNPEDELVEEAVDETVEATEEEPVELTIEQQLVAAQDEAAGYLDGWRRERAELANAKRRLEKQRIDSYQNATVSIAQKLLPALDDFERAMENAPEPVSEDAWFEGIQIVQRKLNVILEGMNIEQIVALHQEFDPVMHEAVTSEPTDDVESGHVSRVLQNGYKIGDRVIRPALVAVAS